MGNTKIDISSLRRIFKRGGLALNENKVIVRYQKSLCEEFRKQSQYGVEFLIASADKFRMVLNSDKGIYLVFEMPQSVGLGFDNGVIEKKIPVISEEQLDSLQVDPDLLRRVFEELPSDAPIGDVIFKAFEILDRLDAPETYDFGMAKRWSSLSKASIEFDKLSPPFELEKMPPRKYSQTGMLIYSYMLYGKSRRVIEFSGRSKDALLNLLRASDGVEFEPCVCGENSYFDLCVGVDTEPR